jgi:hypothetical protein
MTSAVTPRWRNAGPLNFLMLVLVAAALGSAPLLQPAVGKLGASVEAHQATCEASCSRAGTHRRGCTMSWRTISSIAVQAETARLTTRPVRVGRRRVAAIGDSALRRARRDAADARCDACSDRGANLAPRYRSAHCAHRRAPGARWRRAAPVRGEREAPMELVAYRVVQEALTNARRPRPVRRSRYRSTRTRGAVHRRRDQGRALWPAVSASRHARAGRSGRRLTDHR